MDYLSVDLHNTALGHYNNNNNDMGYWRWVGSPHESNLKSTNRLDSEDSPVANDPVPILPHMVA